MLPAGLDMRALIEGMERPAPPARPTVMEGGEPSLERIEDTKKAFLEGPEPTRPLEGD